MMEQFRKDGFVHDFNAKIVTRDGRMLDIVFDGQRIESDDGDHILFVSRDVTEHNRVEEQLRQAQKMEAVGQLTGGVVHDFNNLLLVVETNLELSLALLPDEIKVADLLNRALRTGRCGARLTKQLLAFSRRQTLNRQNIDPRAMIAGIIPLLVRTLGEDISIRTEFSDDIPNVSAGENGLTNAILNLAINARAAMPKGGIDVGRSPKSL